MPRDFELSEFERLYRQYNVTDVVRTCEECQYTDEFLKGLNIEGHVAFLGEILIARCLCSPMAACLPPKSFSSLWIYVKAVLVLKQRIQRQPFPW